MSIDFPIPSSHLVFIYQFFHFIFSWVDQIIDASERVKGKGEE